MRLAAFLLLLPVLGIVACSDGGGSAGGPAPGPSNRSAPRVDPFGVGEAIAKDPWLPSPLAQARWLSRDVRTQTIVSDLELVLAGDLVIERGDMPNLALTVFNRSAQRAHAVVNASDGSREGWREPHLFFDVEIRSGDSPWRTATRARYGRCGNYDTNWAKDVVTLAPNESLDLDDVQFPYATDIEDASEIRITAHYRYGVTRSPDSWWRTRTAAPAEIAGVPDFELVSSPFVVTVGSSVNVTLTRSFDVVLSNETDVEQPIAQNGRASVELLGDESLDEASWLTTRIMIETRKDAPALRPREQRTIARRADLSRHVSDEPVAWDRVRRARVRYSYAVGSGDSQRYREVSSAWQPRESLALP